MNDFNNLSETGKKLFCRIKTDGEKYFRVRLSSFKNFSEWYEKEKFLIPKRAVFLYICSIFLFVIAASDFIFLMQGGNPERFTEYAFCSVFFFSVAVWTINKKPCGKGLVESLKFFLANYRLYFEDDEEVIKEDYKILRELFFDREKKT